MQACVRPHRRSFRGTGPFAKPGPVSSTDDVRSSRAPRGGPRPVAGDAAALVRRAALAHDRDDRRRAVHRRPILDRLADPTGPAGRLAGPLVRPRAVAPPIVLTGCGTSEHGAQAVRRDPARRDPRRRTPRRPGTSCRGPGLRALARPTDRRPRDRHLPRRRDHGNDRAMDAAGAAGARVGVITGSARSPAGAPRPRICRRRRSRWTRAGAIRSATWRRSLAATAIGAQLSGAGVDAAIDPRLLADGASDESGRDRDRGNVLAGCRTILTSRPARTGRRLASSRSRSRRPPGSRPRCATWRRSSTATCRRPTRSTGLVLILTDRDGRRRPRRAGPAGAGGGSGGRCAQCARSSPQPFDAALIPSRLTPAGRLIVDEAADLPAAVASLISTATPLQLLTERIARARGTNPDLIRRDDPTYRAAAEAADSAG